MKRRVIEFKSVSPLYEQEKSGDKPFITTKIEAGDKRFLYLGNMITNLPSNAIIKIYNFPSQESFERRILAVEILPKCPWWMVIYFMNEDKKQLDVPVKE